MAQEITGFNEVSTIDKTTEVMVTKDGGLGKKTVEEIGNVINGTGDISGIGDGTVKGAIRGLNDEIKYIHCKNLYGGDVKRTITFSGKVQTRAVVALIIIAGQGGISDIITIMFGGAGGVEDISKNTGYVSEYGKNLGVSFEGNVLTIPPLFYNWGNFTIIPLDKNLNWISA